MNDRTDARHQHASRGSAVPNGSASREDLTALFHGHATARLRGDTAEAARLTALIGGQRRMIHHMFVLALFSQVVLSELTDRPDPCDLAELTGKLHHKHHRTNPRFKALKAEALIRAVCGESRLLTEIAYAEQPAYLWAVMCELVPPDSTDGELAARYRVAEESGAAWRNAALEEPYFASPGPENAAGADPDTGPVLGPGAETAAARASRQEAQR